MRSARRRPDAATSRPARLIRAALALLLFLQSTPLRAGLKRTIQYFDQLLRRYGAIEKPTVSA